MKRLLAALLCMLVMITAADAETWYIQGITADRVHLREEPDGNSRSLGLYFQGTPAQRQTPYFNTEWIYAVIGTEEGYVHRDYLTKEQPESLQPVYRVSNPHSSWVHLRADASTQSESLDKFDNGTLVAVLGETSEGWCYVSIGERTGYMLSSMLSPIHEEMQTSRLTEVVGHTSDGWLIHAYKADNGQTLYFTALEAEVNILRDDVNFDGEMDLVVFTSLGASNAYCEFFIWQDGQYVMADHPGIGYALCNYQLYPEKGIVATHANNGNAGAAHDDCLFRWEGTRLELIRRSVGENRMEYTFANGISTETTYHHQITMTVYDYTISQYEGTLLYEKTIFLGEGASDELEQAKEALWQGI